MVAAIVLCAASGGLVLAYGRMRVRCPHRDLATRSAAALLICGSAVTGSLVMEQSGLEAGIIVALLGVCAIVSVITDSCAGLILDCVTLPATAGIVSVAAVAGDAQASLAGAAGGGGTLALMWLISRGNAIGLGDAKLGACIGAALGFERAETVLGVAFVLGGLYAVVAIARGASRGDRVCFAPYLALASGIVVAWGNR